MIVQNLSKESYNFLRNNPEEQKKAAVLYEELGRHFWSIVGPANYSAVATMLDAIDAMEEAGLLRQKLKQLVKRAQKSYRDYINAAKVTLEDRFYLWQDLTAHAHDRLQPDITKLFFSIKQRYDREKVKDSSLLSHVQTVCTMLSLSTGLFDATIDYYQKQTYLDISSYFRKGRLTGIETIWGEVMDIVIPTEVQMIPLARDENSQRAVSVIARRYQDMDFLDKAAVDAMRLNPSMIKYAAESDRQHFLQEGEGGTIGG